MTIGLNFILASISAIMSALDLLKITAVIQWNIKRKKLLLLATKLKEKIPDDSNVKEYYNYFFKKNKKRWHDQK